MWNLKNPTSEYNKKEENWQRKQASSYQKGEGSGERQYGGKGLRGTD